VSELFPPSINGEVLSLNERIGRAKMMYAHFNRTTIEQAIAFGRELNAIKEQCAIQGKPWLPVLEKMEIHERQGQRFMRFGANYALLESHIRRDSGSCITLEEADEIIRAATPVEWKFCSHDCRVGKGRTDCKKCAKLNRVKAPRGPKPPKPPYTGPERLAPVFEEVEQYESAARTARRLRKKLQKIERGVSYPITTRYVKIKEHASDKAINIERTMKQRVPSEPCPDCDTVLNASEDSDPCPTCKGKGYLTVADLEVIEKPDMSGGNSDER
jgi:hypothetical protein